ncbi:MAG: amidohydrolase family protein [Alphaproteobacteria bacterium]|nr:amidohydrolase family protein [Alphaproteobacteria bacterium]
MSTRPEKTTCIKEAAWVIAWDETARRPVYRRDIDVVFAGNRIISVGGGYRKPVDETIDGRRYLVMPGLIDAHSHAMSENVGRGVTEELGNPQLYMSGLFDLKPPFLIGHSMAKSADNAESLRAANEVAMAELLMSGVTTIADLGMPYEGWADTVAGSGIRAVIAPMYRSARWVVRTGHSVEYEWDEKGGERAMREALDLVDRVSRHQSGRLTGMVSPAQVDTCSKELLLDSLAEAKRRGLPVTLHCGQAVWEFLEITRRHGKTPMQWLGDIGFLTERTLLAHAIFIDTHSWLRWHTKRDVALLAETGTSVAHCPTVFSRYGQMMENVGAYIRAGVNVAIGTDTQPHNMLEELRTALILGRIAAEDVTAVNAAEIFAAATSAGARALLREDIGRIAVGTKADLVLIDLDEPTMMPARDPLRSLLFTSAERAVREVYVDGVRVVAEGEPLFVDRRKAAERLARAQERIIAAVPQTDLRKRQPEAISPLTLPLQ